MELAAQGIVGVSLDYAYLPTSFERFRCELNRKKSKFERNRWFQQLSDGRVIVGRRRVGSRRPSRDS